jgi:hypothetical protein
MVATVNGSTSVDSDDCGRPILYSEKEAQSRARALALELGESYFVCVMEYIYAERGKMITERIDPRRPTSVKEIICDIAN